MAKLSEMSTGAQLGIFLLIGLVLTGVIYYFGDKQVMEANAKLQSDVLQARAENVKLKEYEPQLAKLNADIAGLEKQQSEILKIVPTEKKADQFIHMIQDNATGAGIDVRYFEAQGVNDKGFYSEMPFNLQLDGSYYAMLKFFGDMAKSERIVNVSNLQVAAVKAASDAKTKKTYQYGPEESVVATCVATTFFTHERVQPPAAAAKPKAGGK